MIIWKDGFYKAKLASIKKVEGFDPKTKTPSVEIEVKMLPYVLIENGEEYKLDPTEPIVKRFKVNNDADKQKITNTVKMITNNEFSKVGEFAKVCRGKDVGIHYITKKNERGYDFSFWDFTTPRLESDDFGDL